MQSMSHGSNHSPWKLLSNRVNKLRLQVIQVNPCSYLATMAVIRNHHGWPTDPWQYPYRVDKIFIKNKSWSHLWSFKEIKPILESSPLKKIFQSNHFFMEHIWCHGFSHSYLELFYANRHKADLNPPPHPPLPIIRDWLRTQSPNQVGGRTYKIKERDH